MLVTDIAVDASRRTMLDILVAATAAAICSASSRILDWKSAEQEGFPTIESFVTPGDAPLFFEFTLFPPFD